jgi:hypothetical protein
MSFGALFVLSLHYRRHESYEILKIAQTDIMGKQSKWASANFTVSVGRRICQRVASYTYKPSMLRVWLHHHPFSLHSKIDRTQYHERSSSPKFTSIYVHVVVRCLVCPALNFVAELGYYQKKGRDAHLCCERRLKTVPQNLNASAPLADIASASRRVYTNPLVAVFNLINTLSSLYSKILNITPRWALRLQNHAGANHVVRCFYAVRLISQ